MSASESGPIEPLVKRVVTAVLETHGHTDPALRRAIEAGAAALGGRAAAEVGASAAVAEVPVALGAYVDKVATRAYAVTDEHVDALRHQGYTEDAIFELTVTAALGAGLARLERGLAALGRETPSS